MIRVNLLASPGDHGAYVDQRRPSWIAFGGGLATVLAVVVVSAWWTWTLRAEAAEVSRALGGAEATLRSLAPAVDRVRELEDLRADLLGHAGIIDQLHAGRTATLRMLDWLSRGLPGDVWFSEVREQSDGVSVRGQAATLATVSDYVAALESARPSGAAVELVDSQRGDRLRGREIVDFEVRVSLPMAGGPP